MVGDYDSGIETKKLNKMELSVQPSMKTPEKRDKIPITANLISKLRNNRRGIATASFTRGTNGTVTTRNNNT